MLGQVQNNDRGKSVVDFSANKLPSSMREIDWHWRHNIQERFDLSQINIDGKTVDFNLPSDYFELTDDVADKLSLIGKKYSFFSQPVSITDVELNIWGNISVDMQIGVLLNNIKYLRPTADVYGLSAKYKYTGKSVYCGITVCFVDKDFGEEMETAVFEIGEDEGAYILPVAINEEVLEYCTFDDLAKLAYCLGNLWVGVQYELNNCPEEIRIVEQHGSITASQEADIRQGKRLVWVKRVIPVDADGNEIKDSATGSNRHFTLSSWSVRGHGRTLPDGRITLVRPYRKGNDRKNPASLAEKEYKFIDGKVIQDSEE